MRGELAEYLRFLEGTSLALLSSLRLCRLLCRGRRPVSSDESNGVRLRVGDRLSLPRRLGEGLRLISSRTGLRLGLRLRDREGDDDGERLSRRVSRRGGDLERLGESEYLRLLGAGERDLLLSDLLRLSGEDVFLRSSRRPL